MFPKDKLSISVNSTENADIINNTLVDKSHLVVPGKDTNSKDNPQSSAPQNIKSNATSLNNFSVRIPSKDKRRNYQASNRQQRESKSTRTPKQHQLRRKKKASIQCPFLQRRGHCLKGPRCDFSHKNVIPTVHKSNSRQNSIEKTPFYNIPPPDSNQFPFPFNPNHFPPFRHLMFPPLFQPPLPSYPPPLMSLVTRPPAY